MKSQLTLSFLFLSLYLFGQVGIGTQTPRGALDINSPIESIGGLVLPSNENSSNIKNPQDGGNPVAGTIFYDIQNSCIKLYKNNGTWSECFCEDCSPLQRALTLTPITTPTP